MVVCCSGCAFLFALVLFGCVVIREPDVTSLLLVGLLDICVEFLLLIVSRRREVSLLVLRFVICFLVLDVVSVCLLFADTPAFT